MILQKITDKIYYLPHDEATDRCSLGLIVGTEHCLMVDAGASKEHIQLFLDGVKELSLPLPDFAVLTHWHWDHTYGLYALDVVSFATKRTNELLKKMTSWTWSDADMRRRIALGEDLLFSYEYQNTEYPDKSKITVVPATVEFEEDLTISLGDITVQLKRLENSHSPDCCVVLAKEEKCIFLGDIHYEDLLPNPPLYYKDKHIQLIQSLKEMDFSIAVSGHQMPMSDKQLYQQLAVAMMNI